MDTDTDTDKDKQTDRDTDRDTDTDADRGRDRDGDRDKDRDGDRDRVTETERVDRQIQRAPSSALAQSSARSLRTPEVGTLQTGRGHDEPYITFVKHAIFNGRTYVFLMYLRIFTYR